MHSKLAGTVVLTSLLGAALATVSVSAATTDSKPAYALAHTFVLGGDGSWDYLMYDSIGRRLFISRATHVMVVDPASGNVLAEIPNTPGVHGIALAPDLGKGFTSNGRDGSVSIFDLAKLTVRQKLSIAGKNPDAIAYDPISKHVFTMNGGSDDATVIDAATETVVASSPLPGRPEFAVSGRDGFVYANIEDKSEIVAIDTKTNGIAHTWPLAPCEEPSGLAIDAEHHRLFSGCHNSLMAVVDAGNGKVVTTLPIGTGVDATAFDPGTQLAFSSNGDGTLTVIHEDSPDAFSVAQNATTRPRARTMALDTITHDVLLVTADVTEGPPAPGLQRPTRTIVPGTFAVLVMTESAR